MVRVYAYYYNETINRIANHFGRPPWRQDADADADDEADAKTWTPTQRAMMSGTELKTEDHLQMRQRIIAIAVILFNKMEFSL